MSRTFLVAAAVTCVLASACGDRSSPTEPALAGRPVFRTEQNPDGPGAQVLRIDDLIALTVTDSANAITVTAGFTPETLAARCAQESFLGQPAFQAGVLRPDGSLQNRFYARDVTVMVFLDNLGDICAGPPFAIGTGDFRTSDNDLFVSGERTNAAAIRLVGQVTGAAGERHHVLVAIHGLIDRDGEPRFTRNEIVIQ